MSVLRLLERLTGPRPERTSPVFPLAAGVLAACITVLFLEMRVVMEVGGACATGGPYVIATPCPKGTAWMFPVSIIVGMAAALVVALTAGRGPRLWLLAWPALFLSLGWNFLDFGLDPPPSGLGDDPGLDGAWLTCAVVFGLMGGIPLVVALRYGARAVLWGAPIEEPDPVARAAAVRNRTTVVVLALVAVGAGVHLGARLVEAAG